MKRQSKNGVIARAATDALVLAEAGAEVIGAGVVLTAGIVGATAELAVAKVLMSEKKKRHASSTAP